jgi:hypothetical protein
VIPAIIRYVRSEIAPIRLQRERVAVAFAGLAVSAGIGLVYARATVVRGWQLWAWAAAVAATAIALLPPQPQIVPRRPPWGWLLGLLATGLIVRIAFLETIPGWLHPLEALLAEHTRLNVLPSHGVTINPFSTGPGGQPTLHWYIVSLALRALSPSITALRIPAAVAGAVATLATYAAIAVIDGRRTAILASTIMTFYHFHIHWSRLALSNVWSTLWVPLVLAAFAWGWKTKWSGGAVLAGLALGLSQYFHPGSVLAVLLLMALVFHCWHEDPDRRRLGVQMGKLTACAVCTAAPLGLFTLASPEAFFSRMGASIGWNAEAVRQVTGSAGNWWGYFWHQASRSFGAYFVFPDVSGFYDPGVPFLFGVSALAFLVGAFLALRSRNWLPLAWVAVPAVAGGFLMRGVPSASELVVSIPGIAWLVAIPLERLISRGRWKLALALLAAILASDLVFYFGLYVLRGAPGFVLPFPATSSTPGL